MTDHYRRLKRDHNYKTRTNKCMNCKYYVDNVEIETDTVANICTVDFDYSLPETEQVVHIMPMPYGVCDDHERK